MGLDLEYIKGQTPIDEEEKEELKIKTISTRGELDEFEQANIEKSIEWKGEPRGIYEIRRHLSNYFKGLPYFKEIRMKLVTLLDVPELIQTLDSISEKYGDRDDSQQADDYSYFQY